MTDSEPQTRAVPAIWGNIPQRNKNFTGRDEIFEQLRHRPPTRVTALLPMDPLPRALQGLGGVGKTAVAIEYAHRARSDYELVWWIPADELALVRSSLAALATRLGMEAATASGIESAAAAVLDALRRGEPYRHWLLIFDNADQPEELTRLIPHGPGDVLITSRNHRWESVAETVQVDVFSRAESTEFLARRVPKGMTDSEADRLAEELGDLPLALEQAGALQAETGMSADEYIRLLEEHAMEILAEGKSAEYPRSMTAAWTLSVATMHRQMPQAQELLRCCAFFGPDPIPRDLFRRGQQEIETPVGLLISNPIMLARAIRVLGRFALVKLDGRAILVHRLVQALIRDDLTPEERDEYQHEVHLILAAGGPRSPEDSRLWPRYAELVAHMAAPATDLEGCLEPEVRAFALEMVRYLYRSGDLASAHSFAERFVERWTEDSGADNPSVLDARRYLGNALRELGQYSAAYTVTEATMQDAARILGDRQELTLALRNSFGADLRSHGEFLTARNLDLETLRFHEEVFGATHPQTLRVMSNLALDHALNSDYQAARDLHQRVYLMQSEATAGVVSATEILNSWNGLARAVRLCGNYTEARDVGEDARDYGRERLGPDHYLTLRAANDLSIALRHIAIINYEDALAVAEEVFEKCSRLFGERHPDTLAAAMNLVNILRTTGRTDDALALAKLTVAHYPEVYGLEHPYRYGCAGNLAVLQRASGDRAEARRLSQEALDGLDATLTRDHDYSLTVATNMASDLAALGETARARALGEDTLRRLRALLGENHPLSLGCAANMVLDLRAEGAQVEADSLLADTLNRYNETLGPDHPDVIVAIAGGRLDFDFDPPPI
jgi:tetratricopeptide (TPR) repeat protein